MSNLLKDGLESSKEFKKSEHDRLKLDKTWFKNPCNLDSCDLEVLQQLWLDMRTII